MTTPAERIRAMRRDVAQMRDTLTRLDALIAPAVVALTNASGDGWGNTGANGVGYIDSDGTSDPVGAAIARESNAIELDRTLRIAWTTMTELPNAVTAHLRRARALTPSSTPRVATCGCGIHLHGYETWGPKDSNGAPVSCDEIAEPDRAGLSLRCYRRRARWLIDQRAREDVA